MVTSGFTTVVTLAVTSVVTDAITTKVTGVPCVVSGAFDGWRLGHIRGSDAGFTSMVIRAIRNGEQNR